MEAEQRHNSERCRANCRHSSNIRHSSQLLQIEQVKKELNDNSAQLQVGFTSACEQLQQQLNSMNVQLQSAADAGFDTLERPADYENQSTGQQSRETCRYLARRCSSS